MPTLHMGNREIVLRSPRSLLLGLVFPSSLGGQDIRGEKDRQGVMAAPGFCQHVEQRADGMQVTYTIA